MGNHCGGNGEVVEENKKNQLNSKLFFFRFFLKSFEVSFYNEKRKFNNDDSHKILLLGDSGVGKSS